MTGLEILHKIAGSGIVSEKAKRRMEIDPLLCACFSDTARDYVGHYVSGLYPSEKQLADLAKSTDGIEVGLTKRANTAKRCKMSMII